MERSIWKWSLISLVITSCLFTVNGIRVNSLSFELTMPVDLRAHLESPATVLDREVDTAPEQASTVEQAKHTTVSPQEGAAESQSVKAFYVPGEFVQLLPESPATVPMPGVIQGVVKLSNPHGHFWRVTIEGNVTLANGLTQTVLAPRTILMTPKQTLQRSVKLRVDSQHFVPGETHFKAILKDAQGQIIDQASVTFTLTVDFP